MGFLIIFQTIQEGIEFLDSWESDLLKGKIKKSEFLTMSTAEGLRVTLHSTRDLIHFLHGVGFDYVLTAKINQDKLEVSLPLSSMTISKTFPNLL